MITDKIYLVGFMASGKSTIARALAARLRWRAEDVDDLIEARERSTIAQIFATAGRAVLPRRRARDPRAAAPDPARRRRHGRRDVRRPRQPRGDQSRRRLRLDRRPARRSHPADPARRPAAARRQPGRARAALRRPGRRLPPRPRPRPGRARAGAGRRRSRPRGRPSAAVVLRPREPGPLTCAISS